MQIYDATYYATKPEYSGFTRLDLIHENSIYPRILYDPSINDWVPGKLDETKIKPYVKKHELVCFDIEGEKATPDELMKVAMAIDKNGISKFGFYGYPIRPSNVNDFTGWLNQNEPYKPLLKSVDAIFPSLYTVTNELEIWAKMLRNAIDYARSVAPGVPVYPFIWWLYHQNYADEHHQFIGDKFWQFQLNQCRRYADGVVIWGGGYNWDENASWWSILKEYL